jgi:hypothetical protein
VLWMPFMVNTFERRRKKQPASEAQDGPAAED